MSFITVNSSGTFTAPVTATAITGGGSEIVSMHIFAFINADGLFTIPVAPDVIVGGGPAVATSHKFAIINDAGLFTLPATKQTIEAPLTPVYARPRKFVAVDVNGTYTFKEFIDQAVISVAPIVEPYVPLPEYSLTLDSEISNYDPGYEPTSVYINGIQTWEYVYQDGIVYFNTTQVAGTTLTFVPPAAIRFLNDAVTTLSVTDVGFHSLFSKPFGGVVFSSDGVTWCKSLSRVFPATVYCKMTPQTPVTDYKCKADFEVKLWRGDDNMFINEDGLIEVTVPIPVGTTSGGLEYNVI